MKITNPLVFKEYDIRGIVDKDNLDELAVGIGKAFGTKMMRLGKTVLNVGRDCRLTSDRLYQRLAEGLLSTGCTIRNIGMCTTPILYFSIFHFKADGGIMLTASHNPGEYNGFKLCVGTGTIYGQEIQQLREMVEKDDFVSGTGKSFDEPVSQAYEDYIVNNCSLKRTLKVVVDAGNGTGGAFAVPILKRLGCEVIPLFCEIDGTFPNHHPDPTVPKNLKTLSETVVREKASVGIAYDGDSDRVGVVDEQGHMIFCDSLMILFAKEILSRKPGATFISEVKCSKNMYAEIERMGGKPIMWKTGHSLIKAKMKETKAELAGELSGHMFFKDRYFGFDDAIYASVRLLEILAAHRQTISDMLAHIPKTSVSPEIRYDCHDTIKFKVVEKAVAYFKQQNFDVIDVDGARVTVDGGWGLIRASNTQPALVLRFEADTELRLTEIQKYFMEKVRHFMTEVS